MERPLSQFLAVLSAHEWSWKEGWRVYCPTCGAEYRDSVPDAKRRHRPGCAYHELVKQASLPEQK
jgi:hypothetical protein